MTTKKIFITDKLKNLINWIEEDKLLANDHILMLKLRSFIVDQNGLSMFLLALNEKCDMKGNIEDDILLMFLKEFGVQMDKFGKEDIAKFKKYIRCFICTLRS